MGGNERGRWGPRHQEEDRGEVDVKKTSKEPVHRTCQLVPGGRLEMLSLQPGEGFSRGRSYRSRSP